MTITLSPNLEAEVREKASAQGVPVEAYIEQIIAESLHGEPAMESSESEFLEIRTAVMEGLEQIERGEGREARSVFAALRAKHALPR